MNCTTIQNTLNERFDEGVELATGFEAHLANCTECGKVLNELTRLNTALSEELPAEVPDALAANIKVGLARERRKAYWPAVATVAGLALLALTATVNRFVSVTSYAEEGWAWLSPRISGFSWSQPGRSILAQLDTGFVEASAKLDGLSGYSPVAVWTALAVTLALVLALNGFEAVRMRTTESDGESA